MRAVLVQDKSTIKAFQKVPDFIYASDPNYIPHIKQDIEKIFDPLKNKLFRDGKAVRWVFYNKQNELVGRIAAFINAKTSSGETQPTGGIGFFECVNDQNAANFMFDLAKDWLAKNGMEAMDGPINFGERNQFWGCVTENFTAPNSYGMNYNPPYYPALFEKYGFKTYFEQYVFKRRVNAPIQDVFVEKTKRLEKESNIVIKDCVGVSLDKIAKDFLTVYNGAWGGHAGFKPMNLAAANKLMKTLKQVIDKRIIVFAYDGEEPIGFFVAIPELNEIFNKVNGNLNLIGKVKFLYHKMIGTPQTMIGVVFGVVKKWHGKGVEGALINFSGNSPGVNRNYNDITLTWIGDFNPKMIKVCENLGAKRFRELKTYRFLFNRSQEFVRCPIIE